MAQKSNTISQQQRLDQIRDMLSRQNEVSIVELSKHFNVSEMTIRRDLEILVNKDEAIRTHGGAASAKRLTFEFTFRSLEQQHHDRKRAIAQRAVEHIRDGQTVILDTGTTTLEIARQLRNRRKVKIITTSLAIVSELQFAGEIQTILLGGYMREGSPDLHGPLTERNLSEFHADIAFLGADAVTESGVVYTEDPAVANLDKLMSQVSDKTIIVTNSSKFSARAMCRILGSEEYDALITDEFLESEIEEKLRQTGVNIEIVNVESKNTSDRKEGTNDTGN